MIKVKIIIPYLRDIQNWHCVQALKDLPGYDIEVDPRPGTYIGKQRNKGITLRTEPYQVMAKDRKIMFMDSDVLFTNQDFIDITTSGKEVICYPYPTHRMPEVLQCGEFVSGRPGVQGMKYTTKAHGLKKIGWSGGGFLYCEPEVFERIRYPYFYHPMIQAAGCREEGGEDIGFFMNLLEHGIDAWCDFDHQLDHIRKELPQYHL